MGIQEQKIENQIHFWSLVGPFFLLLSIAILNLKAPHSTFLTLSSLIGIPLCLRWKTSGFYGSLVLLGLAAFFSYEEGSLADLYWYLGIVSAIGCSFFIFYFSLLETGDIIEQVEVESNGRLTNLLSVGDKWKEAEEEWTHQKKSLLDQIHSMSEEKKKIQEEKQTFFRLAQLTKEEFTQLKKHYEQTKQGLNYKKQQVLQLEETLAEAELAVQRFVDSDPEKEIKALQEALQAEERDKEYLKVQKDREGARLTEENEKMQTSLLALLEEQKARVSQLEALKEQLLNVQSSLEERVSELSSDCIRKTELSARAELEQADMRQKLAEKNHSFELQKREFLRLLEEKDTFEAKNHALIEASKQQLREAQSREEEISKLKNEQALLEKRINESQEELVRQKEELSRQQQNVQPSCFSGNRKVESMYLQLKEQFQEKSTHLDAARKELFAMSQELESRQKEWNETEVEEGYLFEVEYLKLAEEIEALKKEKYTLSQLVDSLIGN